MSSFKVKIATVAAIAVAAGSALLMTAGAASATTPTTPAPAITNDPNASNGTLAFYDSTGNLLTSGSNLNHLFDYALASTAGRPGATKATLYLSFPDHNQSDSQNWVSQQQSPSTNYPNATAPMPPNPTLNPLVTASAADANLNAAAQGVTLDTSPGYAGIVQVRVYDSGPRVSQSTTFWASDIYYDATAGTWQQVYPAPPAAVATSVSTPTANPASPAPTGTTSVALSSTVTATDGSKPAGTVELFNGTTDLGAATYTASSGAVSATASVASGNSYSFTFKFTPTSSAYTGSTSSALAYSVQGVAKTTTTSLTGPSTANTGDSVAYVAAVSASTTPGASDGKVQFSVNGTNSGAPVALDSTGHASFAYTVATAGSYAVVATFIPTSAAAYSGSTSNTVTTTVSAAAYNPDPQTVTVTVPKGTLVISTPYTPANPFKLGTMSLNSSGTLYSASAPFGDPTAPASSDPTNTSAGVEITDTRGGTNNGWTASAQTTDFTNPSLSTVIDGNNLTFTNVTPKYFTGNALQAGSVTTTDIAAFKTAKKSFATTTTGPGSVNITGVLGLTAPTSTLPGDYTATVTFTIA